MSLKEWSTTYPTIQDVIATVQPDLVNASDVARVSQIHTLRDKLQLIALEVGSKPGNQPSGSLRDRVAILEGSGLGTFLSLTDAPDSYYLQAGKVVRVKSDESGLEFGTGGGGAGAYVELTDTSGEIIVGSVPIGCAPESGDPYLGTIPFSFQFLDDSTPGPYLGNAGKYLRVNPGATALEYAAGGGGAANFLDLTDTPDSYYLQGHKVVRVNGSSNALEFATPLSTFVELGDCPSSYVGHAGEVVKVNSGATALEFGAGGSGGLDRMLVFADDTTFSETGTSWVTKKQFRLIFDPAKTPTKVRGIATFWRSTGTTGLACCRMVLTGPGVVTIDLGTTAVETEGSMIANVEQPITGLWASYLIVVQIQIKLASGTGTAWVSYTDLIEVF